MQKSLTSGSYHQFSNTHRIFFLQTWTASGDDDFGLDFDTQTMCLIGGSVGFFQSLKKLKSPLIFPGNQPSFVAHNFKFLIFAHTQITMPFRSKYCHNIFSFISLIENR